MKIAVIISDATHLVNAGTDVVRTYRTFDLPNDIAEYIEAASRIAYATVSSVLPRAEKPVYFDASKITEARNA